MGIISVSELRKNLYNVIKNVAKTNEPIIITSRNAHDSAVLISKKDWEDIQETLYLQSNKDAHKTILTALNTPIEEGVALDWKNGK